MTDLNIPSKRVMIIDDEPAARAHLDNAECSDHPGGPKILAQGSDSVYINGQPAARVGDRTGRESAA